MVSAINPLLPENDVPAIKQDLRNNLAAAKIEIEALQGFTNAGLADIVEITASGNAQIAHAAQFRLVRSNSGSPITYTITANVIPVRSVINLLRWNTGAFTVEAGAGVTLNYESGYSPSFASQYTGGMLIHDPLNTWTLVGKLTPI